MKSQREDVARIIDPSVADVTGPAEYVRSRKEAAYQKADAILALLSAPQDRDVGATKQINIISPAFLNRIRDCADRKGLTYIGCQEVLSRIVDLIDEELAELASTPPSVAVIPEGWQPFRTAPRDGTPFLAYWLRRHTDQMRFEAAMPYVVAAFYADTRIIPTWVAEDLPTHWMPLPAAPASPSPVVDAPVATGEKLEAEEKEMFRLADRLGYVCTPEPLSASPSPALDGAKENLDARYERAKAKAQAKADAIIALLSAPQDRDVGAMKSALEFYRDNWRGNMIGDGETPGLSHCFQEPTDALMQDAGYRASDALSLRSASAPPSVAVPDVGRCDHGVAFDHHCKKCDDHFFHPRQGNSRVVSPSVAVIPDGVRNALEQAKDRLEAVQRHQDFGARLPSVQAALVQVRAALIPLSASPSVAVPEGKILTTYNPCLAKLRDGEPFFVLLGRDKQAPDTVDFWATERAKAEGVSDWTKQAYEVASEMRAYSASPSPNAPVTTGEKLEAEEKEMFRLADRLGYVCTPEPHPDSPHVQEQEETRIAIKDEARKEAANMMPCTAENPNESDYERGKFDGVMAYRKAIDSLKGQP